MNIAGRDVSRETVAKLEQYVALLLRWQRIQNLVASSTLAEVWDRHIADSFQLMNHGDSATSWLDLGSGAGFPGLVLAIGMGDLGHVDLIESDHRKCAFLRQVIRETAARATVHNGRIEEISATLPTPEIITARALAPLPQLVAWSENHLRAGARGLFLKGRDVARELTDLAKLGNFTVDRHASLTDSGGCIVEVKWLDPSHVGRASDAR